MFCVGDVVELGLFFYLCMVEVVQLYQVCCKVDGDCKILVSGGDVCYYGELEVMVYGCEFVVFGVDKVDVLMELKSMNMWQNVQFLCMVFV